MSAVEDRLRELGLSVPSVAAPVAAYVPAVRIVKAVVFVSSTPEFTGQSKVANGASELFGNAFGAAGQHARSAVGVAALPLDSPVEVELIVEVS